ncbi:MAG: RdgB/HAM1 family non-canonical purine NTP pyrophosphatase [Lachnospiraceae bacterium]|nr:RdgB/HAM1 family non-canonical purine NTP pyrophosphatase [Lachnospiraceae bacterium]
MRLIIAATTNKDKVKEFEEILGGKVLPMSAIGFAEDVEETGTTFVDNALIKAKAVAIYIAKNCPEYAEAAVLADDSGLEIDYYNGEPGIYSHRWLGDRTYYQAMSDVLADMQDVPDEKRGARFVCAMAVVSPSGSFADQTVRETVEGIVGHEIVGENGFGYDPFFYVPELGCTTAQLSSMDKHKISHRGKALRAMVEKVKQL